MGKCIVSISNKMQRYTVYLYLETAQHVSGGTSTNHQGRIQLYLQHLVFVTPLLLSASIVEELEQGLIVLWVAYATHSTLKPVYWIYEYIGILLGARPILHISRIKVKKQCKKGIQICTGRYLVRYSRCLKINKGIFYCFKWVLLL
jgi:hypothetical protein